MKSAKSTNKPIFNMIIWIIGGFFFTNMITLLFDKEDQNTALAVTQEETVTIKRSEMLPYVVVTMPPKFNKKAKESPIIKTVKYHSEIEEAAKRYKVDSNLIKAIIMTESSYNTKAVSYMGAKGLMQLMPGTARELGVKDCFNPEKNIDGGVRYFKKLLDRFNGNIDFALAAYNAGSRKVKKYKGVPPFKATKLYIKKVNQYYEIYKTHMSSELKSV